MKFEVELFEHLRTITRVILKYKSYLKLLIIGAQLYSKSAYTHFLCKKVWCWMGGWLKVKAGLRIAYIDQSLPQLIRHYDFFPNACFPNTPIPTF